MRKPVILLTLCRRYYELAKNLEKIYQLKGEFPSEPDVVLVWAQPEVGRLWFLQELLASGKLTHVIGRPQLPDETGVSTTYPESHNLHIGLTYIRENYPPDSYVVVQASDVEPKAGVYHQINVLMQEGANAFAVHWANGVCCNDIWHTNFFSVCLDPAYWPPVSEPDAADTLERQWGRRLEHKPGIEKSHNARERFFSHKHESDGMEPWPVRAQSGHASFGLIIAGHREHWLKRLWQWVGVFIRET